MIILLSLVTTLAIFLIAGMVSNYIINKIKKAL